MNATQSNSASATDVIRSVLDAQVAAWNAGDIQGFMAGYWKDADLRFASGGTVRRGWQPTLDGYLRSYPNRSAMGTLRFDDLDIQVLSPTTAYAFGRWHLARGGDYEDATGLFTLIFERHDDEWVVVHDHTSSAP